MQTADLAVWSGRTRRSHSILLGQGRRRNETRPWRAHAAKWLILAVFETPFFRIPTERPTLMLSNFTSDPSTDEVGHGLQTLVVDWFLGVVRAHVIGRLGVPHY